jgi:protein TonB
LHKVAPVYPPLARNARIQGAVVFHATIGADGTVKQIRLASGHPLLVPSASTAVMQFRYQPTIVNGKGVEVLTDISVNFALTVP